MIGRDMTDEAVRAELERIDLNTEDALRLLAELHAGMREIAETTPKAIKIMLSQETFKMITCPKCRRMIDIASKYRKGGKS